MTDAIGKKREVTSEDVENHMKMFTSEVQSDRTTGQPIQHVKYVEMSAKLGTGCDQVCVVVCLLFKCHEFDLISAISAAGSGS